VPRREQLIRAERFAAKGLLDMLHPSELNADALSQWMHDDARPVMPAEDVIDFGGVWRLPRLLAEVMSEAVSHDSQAVPHE
jgi:predicted glycosyltransferase